MTSNVTLCAPFRDSERRVRPFIQQISALDHPQQQLRVICVEGDSIDYTYLALTAWAEADERVTVVKCDTGKPKYPSIVHPERFATLAKVFNTALDAVDLQWSDYVLFTPSDVRFSPDTLARLLAHGKDIIAPFFWGRDGLFHDTWGFTCGGAGFPKTHFANVERDYGCEPIVLDTVGGMALMRAAVLKAGCRYTVQEVDRGLCKMARVGGFSVWADPTTHIEHI